MERNISSAEATAGISCITNLTSIKRLVRVKGLGELVDLVGHAFRSGTTIFHIVLDTKVIVGSTRVVGSGEENAAGRLVFADNIGRGWRGEDTVMADDEFGDTVRRCDAENGLDGGLAVVAAVTTNDERRALSTSRNGEKDRLDEVLGVVLDASSSVNHSKSISRAAYLLLEDLHTVYLHRQSMT